MLKKRFFKTKDECEVTFEFEQDDAAQVALVIDSNGRGWENVPMKRAKSGPFRAKVRLPKDGEFQFRYLIDGETWENDHAADAYWPNEYGSDNSVVITRQ